MFTGIVQGTVAVVAIDEKSNFRTHKVKFPSELLPDLELGASVAHNVSTLLGIQDLHPTSRL